MQRYKWLEDLILTKISNVKLVNILKEKSIFDIINENIRDDVTLKEKCYCFLNGFNEIPKCSCGKNRPFFSPLRGYQKNCSAKCAGNSEETKQKIKNKMLEKYGVENAFQAEVCKEKMKQTWLKNHGVDNVSKSDEIKKKKRNTCLENYGVDNPLQSEEIRTRQQATNLERYGVKIPLHSDEVLNKLKQTNLERYGSECSFSNKDVQEKFKQTMLEKYGVEWSGQREEFIDLVKQTNNEKFGTDFYTQSDAFKENLEIYQEKIYNTKKKNGTFGISKQEEEIYEILCSKFFNVEKQYRSDLYNFSCDFYIYDIDLYIEYQGYWTHGSEPFDENNTLHMKILDIWKRKSEEENFKESKKKQYLAAIDIWTKRDVLKRETAKKNNLNWIEFFNMKQFKEWVENV